MKLLVTKKEEKALKKLLTLSSVPEVTLSYFELRGFLYGIAITPAVVQPPEWIPVIFSDENINHKSEEQTRELMASMFTVLNKHIAAFQRGTLQMPFDMENIKEEEFEQVFEWTSGLEEALSLRPECWEEHDELSEEERDHLVNSLVVIEGIVYPEDAVDMFDHIPKKELLKMGVNMSGSDLNRVMQVQFFLLQALELSVKTIQNHAVKLEEKRKANLRTSRTTAILEKAIIDKNVDCPCGSGKKFSECCSLPDREEATVKTSNGKKGKIIKVDFSKGIANRKLKKKDTEQKSNLIYQIEITLAYSKPEIWRRIQLPSTTTLAEFHKIIQLAMGWQDHHLHQFQAGQKFYGPQIADDYADRAILDDSRFTLAAIEKELLQGVVYTYDFGDNWEHVIMLEKVMPANEGKPYPIILDGARACPPEDIGGIPMFEEFLDYLSGSNDDELREMFDVPGLQGYDPELFDMQALNQFFESVYRDDK